MTFGEARENWRAIPLSRPPVTLVVYHQHDDLSLRPTL